MAAGEDRPDSFQPEKPHPQTRGAGGTGCTLYVVAGVAAAMVVMLMAIAAPRLFGSGALRWAGTLGAGVLAFAVVFAIGRIRSS